MMQPEPILPNTNVLGVMYNTWEKAGSQGWANGGTADGIIGAFWCHPNAVRDGGTTAHEFTHSLQSMVTVDKQNKFTSGSVFSIDGIFYQINTKL